MEEKKPTAEERIAEMIAMNKLIDEAHARATPTGRPCLRVAPLGLRTPIFLRYSVQGFRSPAARSTPG
jgi:hypothetical protein